MMMTFVGTTILFGLFMTCISVGVIARRRGLKGPCKGSGCSCSGESSPHASARGHVQHGVSGCKRTYQVLQSSRIRIQPPEA